MKAIKIEFAGNEEQKQLFNNILKFNGLKADKPTIEYLDNEIEFYVCDLKSAHGNLNKHSRSAWLSPFNNDGSFNISISW